MALGYLASWSARAIPSVYERSKEMVTSRLPRTLPKRWFGATFLQRLPCRHHCRIIRWLVSLTRKGSPCLKENWSVMPPHSSCTKKTNANFWDVRVCLFLSGWMDFFGSRTALGMIGFGGSSLIGILGFLARPGMLCCHSRALI